MIYSDNAPALENTLHRHLESKRLNLVNNRAEFFITSIDEIEQIIEKQNIYCEHQASNKRTFGALKANIGEEKAKFFMEQVLFPKFKTDKY